MQNPFINPFLAFDRQSTPPHSQKILHWFFRSSIKDYQKLLKEKPASYWQKRSEQKALHLFHLAARHVPAYQKFLKKHRLNPQRIKSFQDFQNVPPTDKPDYFSHYSLQELSWHGKLETANTISFSSGSTGKPYFWPRGTYQDVEGAFAFEHLLTSLFRIDQNSTLLVNCFSLGNYVAGLYVYTSSHLVAQKGYPLTVVSPGINYQDTFNILEKSLDQYDQIILCGYPPFLRDIIELGLKRHLPWSKYRLKFLFASEFFSENWRDNTLHLAGNNRPLTDSTNIYGTADSAIFAFETPLTILLRRLCLENSRLHHELFRSDLTPTLVQYQPLLTFFEKLDSELILTANSGLPLIRYNLKDQGRLLPIGEAEAILSRHHFNLSQELRSQNQIGETSSLPLLAVTNRTDGAVSFYAITIYPEYIRSGLETKDLRDKISGKFTLFSAANAAHEPILTVHVELKSRIHATPKLLSQVTAAIVRGLRRRCAEYSFLEKAIKNRAAPSVILHHKGHSPYFKIGIKQRWIAQ